MITRDAENYTGRVPDKKRQKKYWAEDMLNTKSTASIQKVEGRTY